MDGEDHHRSKNRCGRATWALRILIRWWESQTEYRENRDVGGKEQPCFSRLLPWRQDTKEDTQKEVVAVVEVASDCDEE